MRQYLLQWFRRWKERQDIRRYIKGYRQHSEFTEDWKALELMQVEAINKEFEDEEP